MRRRRWVGRTARELQRYTGQEDPVEAVRHIARGLVDYAGLDGPPTNLPMLASFCKIQPEFQYCSMESAGRLVPTRDGKLHIHVNEGHSKGKQRFTIAHEITHTLLPTYQQEYVEDFDTGRFWFEGGNEIIIAEDEALCDAGAAALLMDDRWLSRLIDDAPMSISTLVHGAECFETSLHAMAWQASRISSEPFAYVIWQMDYRKEDRARIGSMSTLPGFDRPALKLRVKRIYPSKTFPSELFIPYNKSVPEISPVGAAIHEPLKYTRAPYDFDLGRTGTVRLYSENISVAVRDEVRVISLLKPVSSEPTRNPPNVDFRELNLFGDAQNL